MHWYYESFELIIEVFWIEVNIAVRLYMDAILNEEHFISKMSTLVHIYQKSLFNMVFIFLGEFITKLYESSIFIG